MKTGREKFLFWLLAGLPLVIVTLSAVGFSIWSAARKSDLLQPGIIYIVWVPEVEAEPRRSNGSSWDLDGSAPDLSVSVGWEETEIMRTVVSANSLIARWDPVALKLSDLMEGEVSTSQAKRVGRFRSVPSGKLKIGVYDEDLLNREHIASTSLKSEELRIGLNEISAGHGVRRLRLIISEAESDLQGAGSLNLVAGANWSMAEPAEFRGQVSVLEDEAERFLDGAANELKAMTKSLSDSVLIDLESVAGKLREKIESTGIDSETAAKRLTDQIDSARKELQE